MILGMLVLGAGVVGNLFLAQQEQARRMLFADYSSEMKAISQEVAKHAKGAAQGTNGSIGSLAQARRRGDTMMAYLRDGHAVKGLAAPTGAVAGRVSELETLWDSQSNHIDVVLGKQESLAIVDELRIDLAVSMAQILDQNENVVRRLLQTGASATQVAQAQRQSYLIERMARSVDQIVELSSNDNFSENFTRDVDTFKRVLDGLGSGAVGDKAAMDSLAKIDAEFTGVRSRVDAMLSRGGDVASVKAAADQLYIGSAAVPDGVDIALGAYRSSPMPIIASSMVAAGLGTLTLILVMATIGVIARQAGRNVAESGVEHEQHQAAIVQLLDELADLADGDLTVQATVTESFTGAIADSINFSIDQTRALVSKINETSKTVSGAATDTRESMGVLSDASQRQASEIADVSESVNKMAVSIDRVSYNAAESFAVAERSVDIANNGASVVQNTIDGMEQIRGQIQETAKRIKRLGESSQEIGDIVALINDIADQTNILSLNAAIQASMAGDAGKGFAVVADEVQRLAERSGAAAKQISALVKTIQSDTNEAVTSMEQATAEVVQGTKLAEDAGVALGEIEGVSKSLAENIENISDAARQQAASAGRISNTMKSIQEITSQTTEGTRATATSVGKLAEMTDELRSSVTGFKLPE
jgi:twitching motility protein PilJ